MTTAVRVDVVDRLLGRVDDPDRHLERQILARPSHPRSAAPIAIARRQRAHALVAVQPTPASASAASAPGRKAAGDVGVDEQRLGRVADARPLQLRVQHDRLRVVRSALAST